MHITELSSFITPFYAKQHNFKEECKMSALVMSFKNSFKELKNIRCLTITGMLIALAVVLRSVAIQITPDLRISFAFLSIVIVAMLFGPVVAAAGALITDYIGFMLNNSTGNPYSPILGLVVVLSGIIYGVFLYNQEARKIDYMFFIKAAFARFMVIFICNICLNSYIIYVSFVNKNFSFASDSQLTAFFTWISPRVIKNLVELPIDIALICAVLPVAYTAYKQIFKKRPLGA